MNAINTKPGFAAPASRSFERILEEPFATYNNDLGINISTSKDSLSSLLWSIYNLSSISFFFHSSANLT